MTKLVVVIVQSRSSKKLKEQVLKEGLGMTILQSSGAFLGKKSSTFLIAVSSEKVEKVLDIVRETCKRKSVFVSDTVVDPVASAADLSLGHDATKLEIGGALVFVVDVEKLVRI